MGLSRWATAWLPPEREAHILSDRYPDTAEEGPGRDPPDLRGTPQSPTRTHRQADAQRTRAARRQKSTGSRARKCGPDGRPSPSHREGGQGRGENGSNNERRGEPDKGPRTASSILASVLRGTKATSACDSPNCGDASVSD